MITENYFEGSLSKREISKDTTLAWGFNINLLDFDANKGVQNVDYSKY